jgi:hypothetical protein
VEQLRKTLADLRGQAGRPFEYEMRLRELVARQAVLNAALDLDKSERQVAPSADGEPEANGNQAAAARERVARDGERGHRPRRIHPEAGEADEAEPEHKPRPGRAPGPGL